MKLIQKISMDFAFHGIPPRVYGKQDDSMSRAVQIDLFNQGEAWPIPLDAAMMVRFNTPAGGTGLYDSLPDGSSAFAVSDNSVTVQLVDQIFAAAGQAECSLRIVSAGAGVSTWTFIVDVERGPGADANLPADYINVLVNLTAEANAAAERAEGAADRAEMLGDPWEETTGKGKVSESTSDINIINDEDIRWKKVGRIVAVTAYASVTYNFAEYYGEYRSIQLSIKNVPKAVWSAYVVTSGFISFEAEDGNIKTNGPWIIASFANEIDENNTLSIRANTKETGNLTGRVRKFFIRFEAIGVASE